MPEFEVHSIEWNHEKIARRGVTRLHRIPTSLSANAYDVVFFIEIIEHLLDDDLESIIAELRRILKPGGTLVITTPNDENLEETEAFCPDCGCSFNRIQHVRSWSAKTLAEFMRAHGFNGTSRTTYFRPTPVGTKFYTLIRRLRRRKQPNLIWIGTRSHEL